MVKENASRRNMAFASMPETLLIINAMGGPISASVSLTANAASKPKRKDEPTRIASLLLNLSIN